MTMNGSPAEFVMRCLCRVAFGLIFAGSLAAAPPPADKGSKLAGWGEVVDPDGDCKVTEDKGTLTLTVPKTHHDLTYQEDVTKLNAPRVLQPVEGDFTLTVTVKAYPPPMGLQSSSGKHTFCSTGLLIWQDDKHYVRLERASSGSGDDTNLFGYMEYFADGKTLASGAA